MASKGLGTGLGALFGESAIGEDNSGTTFVPIAKIEPRQDQPRSVFDETALSELADSIREHGVIQPLTVRRMEKGYYQIIAGERRWRASRIAGLHEVPVRIIEADDKKAMELALVENLQREDLNPIEEALGYRSLMEEYGLTQQETAKRVGKSRPVIANALRLLALPEEVIKMVENGDLTLSHARLLLEIEDEATRIETAKIILEKSLSVRETEALIKRLGQKRPQKPKSAQSPDGVDYIAEAEKELTRRLGRRIKITDGKKKGKIEIEYYGNDDFNTVYEALFTIKAKTGGAEEDA